MREIAAVRAPPLRAGDGNAAAAVAGLAASDARDRTRCVVSHASPSGWSLPGVTFPAKTPRPRASTGAPGESIWRSVCADRGDEARLRRCALAGARPDRVGRCRPAVGC
jgi:hypothetical protein